MPARSFLLQLSLLDVECSGYAPSLLAAAALSLSLEAYGGPAWPREMQQFGSYLSSDLEPVKRKLADLQATLVSQGRGGSGGGRPEGGPCRLPANACLPVGSYWAAAGLG